MPHYKCVTCEAWLRVTGTPADMVGDLCPGCGSLLEPVTELAELVGLRAITPFGGAAAPLPSGSRQRVTDRVDEFVARRTAALERERLEAESWLDDEDVPAAAAVAVPPPPACR
jgi:hypothetical protein